MAQLRELRTAASGLFLHPFDPVVVGPGPAHVLGRKHADHTRLRRILPVIGELLHEINELVDPQIDVLVQELSRPGIVPRRIDPHAAAVGGKPVVDAQLVAAVHQVIDAALLQDLGHLQRTSRDVHVPIGPLPRSGKLPLDPPLAEIELADQRLARLHLLIGLRIGCPDSEPSGGDVPPDLRPAVGMALEILLEDQCILDVVAVVGMAGQQVERRRDDQPVTGLDAVVGRVHPGYVLMARHQDMYLRIPPRASGQTVERLPGIGPLPGDADTFLFGPDRDEHPAVDPVFGLRIAQIGHLEERMPLPLQGDGRPLGAAADGPVTAIDKAHLHRPPVTRHEGRTSDPLRPGGDLHTPVGRRKDKQLLHSGPRPELLEQFPILEDHEIDVALGLLADQAEAHRTPRFDQLFRNQELHEAHPVTPLVAVVGRKGAHDARIGGLLPMLPREVGEGAARTPVDPQGEFAGLRGLVRADQEEETGPVCVDPFHRIALPLHDHLPVRCPGDHGLGLVVPKIVVTPLLTPHGPGIAVRKVVGPAGIAPLEPQGFKGLRPGRPGCSRHQDTQQNISHRLSVFRYSSS